MYKINEETHKQPYTMLIPAMLDMHFPLLKFAFFSKKYYPVVLDAEEKITNVGLKYTHNDLCYPAILIVGQIISALKSGKYDPEKTVILEPQCGDACRGSNYVPIIRKALDKAGFEQVPILSLNIKNLKQVQKLPISVGMAVRAVAAVFYSDLLMILKNQIVPYEVNSGETDRCVQGWTAVLSGDLKRGTNFTIRAMKQRFHTIAEEFNKIPRKKAELPKIAIVGELYIKYCRLGNWNLEKFLREMKCEYSINGFSWYALYYVDSHMEDELFLKKQVYRLVLQFLSALQGAMVSAIREQGFHCMDAFPQFKKNAKGLMPSSCTVGDGWLIGAEIVNHDQNGFCKIIGAQPFGCLCNHVCGKGIYSALQRKLQGVQLVAVDFDASGVDALLKNRICLLFQS